MKTQIYSTFPFPTGDKPTMFSTCRPDVPSTLNLETRDKFKAAVLAKTAVNAKQKAALERARTEAIARKLYDENRAFLLQKAELLGVGVVHIFDECDPKGGMTVAFRKVSRFAKGTMVEVAVATCSKEDSFSRKTGTKLALEAFFNGEVIQLPLNNPDSQEGLSTQVKWAFEGLFYAI